MHQKNTERGGVNKTKQDPRGMWDSFKCTNIYVMWVSEAREKGTEKKTFKDITAKSFPNFDEKLNVPTKALKELQAEWT